MDRPPHLRLLGLAKGGGRPRTARKSRCQARPLRRRRPTGRWCVGPVPKPPLCGTRSSPHSRARGLTTVPAPGAWPRRYHPPAQIRGVHPPSLEEPLYLPHPYHHPVLCDSKPRYSCSSPNSPLLLCFSPWLWFNFLVLKTREKWTRPWLVDNLPRLTYIGRATALGLSAQVLSPHVSHIAGGGIMPPASAYVRDPAAVASSQSRPQGAPPCHGSCLSGYWPYPWRFWPAALQIHPTLR